MPTGSAILCPLDSRIPNIWGDRPGASLHDQTSMNLYAYQPTIKQNGSSFDFYQQREDRSLNAIYAPINEYSGMPADGVLPKHLLWDSPPPSSEGFKVTLLEPANDLTSDWKQKKKVNGMSEEVDASATPGNLKSRVYDVDGRCQLPEHGKPPAFGHGHCGMSLPQEAWTLDRACLETSIDQERPPFNVDMFSASDGENEDGEQNLWSDEDAHDQYVLQRRTHVRNISSYTEEDLAAMYSKIPVDEFGRLTSIGSMTHISGECKPCLFVHTVGGCQGGLLCEFCHFSHKRKAKPRPCKGKRDRYRKLLAKLEKTIEENLDTWNEHTVELPPSIRGNPSLRSKMMDRLRGYAENVKANRQAGGVGVLQGAPRAVGGGGVYSTESAEPREFLTSQANVPTPPGLGHVLSNQYPSSCLNDLRPPFAPEPIFMPNVNVMNEGYGLPPAATPYQYQHRYLSL